MNCLNHPDEPAVGRCAGCAESFCGDCMVTLRERTYCAECKTLGVRGQAAVGRACPSADSALRFAIIGLFCFGIVFGPVAIIQGVNARKQIARNPELRGAGKATAAIIIGVFSLAFWALSLTLQIMMSA